MEGSETVNKYRTAKAEIKKLKENFEEEGKKFFKAAAKVLFEQNPELKDFSWTQYTPYFNDGDVCRFRSNHDYPSVNGTDPDYDDISDGEYTQWKKLAAPVKEFLSQFDKEDMEILFGDHARVTVTRKGITVDSYDHD